MRSWIIATILCGQTALADPPRRLVVAVGDTVEREVGMAIGYRCDDPSLIEIAMRTKSQYVNAATITGKKPGSTTCRFGLDPVRYSEVYELTVLARRPR